MTATPLQTSITMVLDRSGSMGNCRDASSFARGQLPELSLSELAGAYLFRVIDAWFAALTTISSTRKPTTS